MIVRGKSGRGTGEPYKPNLTEPDTHYGAITTAVEQPVHGLEPDPLLRPRGDYTSSYEA